jgi:nitrogen regulatory protein PII
MKEIKAILQPFMLDKVLDALREVEGLPGCIVSHVSAYPRAKGSQSERGFEPRQCAKLEIVVDEPLVKKVVDIIQKNAHTGNKGDGKIFVIECTDVMRIRTGERGTGAL